MKAVSPQSKQNRVLDEIRYLDRKLTLSSLLFLETFAHFEVWLENSIWYNSAWPVEDGDIMKNEEDKHLVHSLNANSGKRSQTQIKGSAFGFLEDGRELNYNPHLTNRKK